MGKFYFQETVLPTFEEHRAEWLARARAVARQLGQGGRVVTVNDVRALCPPPPNVDPRVMGGIFSGKDWELLDYARTNRRACHGRAVGLFRLRGAA